MTPKRSEAFRARDRARCSQSFTPREVQAMDALFATLLRNGDPAIMVRQPTFASVVRKFAAMRAKLERSASDPAAAAASRESLEMAHDGLAVMREGRTRG